VGEMTRGEVVDILLRSNYGRLDLCCQYADVFLEYREASANIAEHGIIVQHPRTMNPIDNPYLAIRDRALKKFQILARVDAVELWLD